MRRMSRLTRDGTAEPISRDRILSGQVIERAIEERQASSTDGEGQQSYHPRILDR
ncbi:unnamed protein product [Ascophyllum nodosum]